RSTVTGLNRAADREQLHQVIDDVAAFEQFQPGAGDVSFRLPVEARAVGPPDPWLPEARHDPANCSGRTRVFEEPDQAAALDDAAEFAKRRHLEVTGQNA